MRDYLSTPRCILRSVEYKFSNSVFLCNSLFSVLRSLICSVLFYIWRSFSSAEIFHQLRNILTKRFSEYCQFLFSFGALFLFQFLSEAIVQLVRLKIPKNIYLFKISFIVFKRIDQIYIFIKIVVLCLKRFTVYCTMFIFRTNCMFYMIFPFVLFSAVN